MSVNGNGHLPEGAVIATLDMLKQANTTVITAKIASERAGAPLYVRIRTIRKARYLAMLPPRPPEAEAWPKEPAEYQKHYEIWFLALSESDRAARRAADAAVTAKILEAGLLDPPYTDELVEAIGDDADQIAVEILRFSDILPAPPSTASPADTSASTAPAAEPVA